MPRRAPYTKLLKDGQVRPEHVAGMGDVVFRGFQCLNSECTEFMFVREEELGPDFSVECSGCGSVLSVGGETPFFDYTLTRTDGSAVIETGTFVTLHDDYIQEAMRFKYCLLCNALKPLKYFDQHASRRSGRQGECRLCKTVYNSIKNQSRLTDQHREAAQRRRLYKILAGQTPRIDSRAVYERFGGQCFNCGAALIPSTQGQSSFRLDHTLPARLLWSITTDISRLSTRNGRTTMRRLPKNRRPTPPGEVFREDFLNPLGITQKEAAERLRISYPRMNEIVKGKRSATVHENRTRALAQPPASRRSLGCKCIRRWRAKLPKIKAAPT